MEKRLSEFLTPETAATAGLVMRHNSGDPFVCGIEYDSRKIKPGFIYCAQRGLHTDGHLFINDAIEKGAITIIQEEKIDITRKDAVFLQVKDSRHALSPISAAFYGFPSRELAVIGVTGTEGKSTTVYLIWQLLRLMGKKAGFFSTVQYSSGNDAQWNSEHQTTPEANAVQRMLREMADNGVQYAVVEASSHGLSERTKRLGDVDFDVGVITNVTHEHLEFHGTWEQYRYDKANLFRALDKTVKNQRLNSPASSQLPVKIQKNSVKPFGVINADDPSAAYFASATAQGTVTFSTKNANANLSLRSIESNSKGNNYEVYISESKKIIKIEDRLPGTFNAGNVLAALLVASGLLELPVEDVAEKVIDLQPVRGRMTRIDKGQSFEVLVDYAHTPASFQTIFPPLRERLDKTGKRIISVFGSAGERDTKKRFKQGKIAANYSDIIVLADEDPRGEVPMAILEEIAQGIDESKTKFIRNENLFLIPDRGAAIRKAFSLAKPGDLVLLLGKGHENSIIYAEHIMPYDEITEAERALG